MNTQKKVYLVTEITAGGQQSGGEQPSNLQAWRQRRPLVRCASSKSQFIV